MHKLEIKLQETKKSNLNFNRKAGLIFSFLF